MDTHPLAKIIKKLLTPMHVSFLGVFSRDQQPSLTRINSIAPCAYVVNTDPSSLPGSHWVAFFHPHPNIIYFFDSFGRAPTELGFNFPTNCTIRFNPYLIQSLTSRCCGQYCIYFLFLTASHAPVKSMLFSLSKLHAIKADKIVREFIHRVLRMSGIKNKC